MISGVLAILLGEAVAARSLPLLIWFGVFLAVQATIIPSWEELQLERRFGPDYREYRNHVPRWVPRLQGWKQSGAVQQP